MSAPAGLAKPLEKLKIVEIGVAMAGPFCGVLLADYGAEVIKIEPIEGDFARLWSPYFPGRMSHYFAIANRNKKSIALDLKSPEGAAVARELIADADVLVANYRVGALDRMGLSYEDLATLNPRLIYCNISGFGPRGPRATEPANDLFMQAYTGGMSLTGEADGSPCKMGMSVADVGAGMFGAIGVLMALEERRHTGRGQRVDTSLLEGQIAMLSYHFTRYFACGEPLTRNGSGGGAGVPYQGFATHDDDIVIAVFNDRMWRNFCVAIGEDAWADDPEYTTAEQRNRHSRALIARISAILKARPARHWLDALAAAEVPCTRINRVDQVVEDEQVQVCEMFVDVPGPAGAMRMPGLPLKFANTRSDDLLPPPELGQHTLEILDRLGYGDREKEGLVARRIVGSPPRGRIECENAFSTSIG